MNEWLSPQAHKNCQAAAARACDWRPSLDVGQADGGDLAIVRRPRCGGWRVMRAFAAWMAANLPEFAYNGQVERGRWEAALPHLEPAATALESDWQAVITRPAADALARLHSLDGPDPGDDLDGEPDDGPDDGLSDLDQPKRALLTGLGVAPDAVERLLAAAGAYSLDDLETLWAEIVGRPAVYNPTGLLIRVVESGQKPRPAAGYNGDASAAWEKFLRERVDALLKS